MNFFLSYKEQLIRALLEHMEITFSAVIIAIVIGAPLGIYIAKNKRIAKLVLSITSVFQTIPSLALFGLIIPILGIGLAPSIFVLFLFALLPIVMNSYIGITQIEGSLLESAQGLGLNKLQILFKVEMPLAIPVIMGGVKVSVVTTIGTATLAALIGAGGLGDFIFRGIGVNDPNLILLGAIPTATMAVMMNYFMETLEKIIKPRQSSNQKEYSTLVKSTFAALFFIIFMTPFIYSGTNLYNEYKDAKRIVTIGHENFTEQRIIANIYKLMIEKNSDYKVKTLEVSGTQVSYESLFQDSVDMLPAYTGTMYGAILKFTDRRSKEETFQIAKKQFNEKYDVDALSPLGFNNTYVIITTSDFAKRNNLNTISDLAKLNGELSFLTDGQFLERADGYRYMSKTYGLNFKSVKGMDIGLLYTAMKNKQSDVGVGYGTDGRIAKYNLKILEDNKNFFPPYYITLLMKNKFKKKHPDIVDIIAKLKGKINNTEMQKLNSLVDSDRYSPYKAAQYYVEKMYKE